MDSCGKCQAFLYDYLSQSLETKNSLFQNGNRKNIRENLYELIDSILRAQKTITEWVLHSVKGEFDMRIKLIRKPETKDEEYMLTFLILKQIGLGFREQIKHVEELVISLDMVRFTKHDKNDMRKEQLLANIFAPLVQILHEIHNEHTIGAKTKQLPKLKDYKFDDEMDILYS